MGSSTASCARGSPPRRSTGPRTHALIRLLAGELGVGRSDIRIVAGATGRQKLLVVDGLTGDAIVARWPGLRV